MSKGTAQSDNSTNFDHLHRFILRNFDHERPFSSFLPGIAGVQGIPMWVFYVNRGQGICSFGIENKDHPILEFQPANKAYQTTPLFGFRTFLNGTRDGESWQREAFSPWDAPQVQRVMFIGMNELEIQEVNPAMGYQVNILYFMLPNEPFSGLVRRVSLKNLERSPLTIEILDGLPKIVPYGVDDGFLKNLGRTIEAWMQADNLENALPFYRLKATPGDTAEVHTIQAGNYAMAFQEESLLPVIADPQAIFGMDTGYSKAHLFHQQGLKSVINTPQILEGRSLCAFFGNRMVIESQEEQVITSLFGYSQALMTLQENTQALAAPGRINKKLNEARGLTDHLTNDVHTKSTLTNFDGYCRQTFLDNLIRGGYPLILGKKQVYHVFSRKHGDIERDYNYFVIPPEYYSQGNGNYRDINQNRRNDVFFVPQAGEWNIRLFMSLIQADGYNPLVLNGLTFSLPPDQLEGVLANIRHPEELAEILNRNFTPGEVLEAILMKESTIPVGEFLDLLFSKAEPEIRAEHGEGYWIDHWTYNLDLIEAYLGIFPDKRTDLLFDSEPLPFYDNVHLVAPRSARYVCFQGKPRQLNAVYKDPEKVAMIKSRQATQHWARSNHGKGSVFRLPLISKLVLLALIKYASRDPSGMGIQMEAGKPGWYDALNGLPALFGSSMPETFELLRLVNFLIDVFRETDRETILPVEAQKIMEAIDSSSKMDLRPFDDWDDMTSALEDYRASVSSGFDGETFSSNLTKLLREMRQNLEEGIGRAQAFADKIPPTYFIHEVTDFDLMQTRDSHGNPHIHVKGCKPEVLPLFLEGPVRFLKIANQQQAHNLAKAVKQSDLFDQKLGMYKVNTSLLGQSHEIGRARAFTPGWLENESIWMHMAFKYLLELLSNGLYDEFFTALMDHLPAFMDHRTYGRSPLENASFIVSSAHPDSDLHGNSFVARLSGSTAEFLSMWCLITAGKRPFQLVDGQLALQFKPTLPGWLFTENGTFTFRFLGACEVVLINPLRKDTYREGVQIKEIKLHHNNKTITIEGDLIGSPYAEDIRRGEYEKIECFYG